MSIEEEVGRGLAYLYARERKQMAHRKAYQWAKKHWMEFLPDFDSATGRMLLLCAQRRRQGEQDGEPSC